MTFGEKMRALMAERGVSLRALAKTLPADPGHLSRISRDLKPPSDDMAAQIDHALGADGTLTALARTSPARPALTPDDEERLLLAARRPVRTDLKVVESLAVVLDAQRRIEDSVGSAPLLEPVRANLVVLRRLVIEARGPVRVKVVHVAAQWAQFYGWLRANVGDLAGGTDGSIARLSGLWRAVTSIWCRRSCPSRGISRG
ncbi:helix-turn-helix domain-containing protein [Actinomadura yumaensis]|uniref:helix-turn-helix domain-containing protein n=1 Tax=Actinomadura yumaensis TaxID=111807 RepID=UPI0036099454